MHIASRHFPQNREQRCSGEAESARMLFRAEAEQELFAFQCGKLVAVDEFVPFAEFRQKEIRE